MLIQGKVDVVITGINGNAFAGQIRMRDPWVCSTSDDGPDGFVEDPDLATDLLKPLLFNQLPTGVITQVQIPTEISVDAANILRGILNTLQVTLMERENSYSVQENGSQGTYQVAYNLAEEVDGLAIEKKIGREDFSELRSVGVDTGLELTNTIHLKLDTVQGVLREVHFDEQTNSYDETQSPDDGEVGGWDGVAQWNRVNTTASLILRSVADTPTQSVRLTQAAYQVDSLGTDLSEAADTFAPIDLETINVAAELDGLEANPTDPAQTQRILRMVELDATGAIWDQISTRLAGSAATPDVARAYIDLLAILGSAAAQNSLVEILTTNPSGFDHTLQEQALIGLALQTEPISSAVAAIQTLSQDADAPLHDTGLLALGSVAGELSRTDPTTANELLTGLSQSLREAQTDPERELFLFSLA